MRKYPATHDDLMSKEKDDLMVEFPFAPKIMAADKTQVGGDHYTRLAVQPWEAMEAWMTPAEFQGFLRGNVIKYLARDKGARLEDWRKALHYLTKLVETAESCTPDPSA